MKRLVLALTLLCCVSAWAQTKPASRADQANEPGQTDRVTRPGYPITVHVISSRLVSQPTGSGSYKTSERLQVLIGGKKYELDGDPPRVSFLQPGVITPGDYPAAVTFDRHKGSYLVFQEYAILFPDNSTEKFYLAGESE